MAATNLTEFQKSRIRFHLGYLWNLPPLMMIEPERRLRIDALPPEIILLVVGDTSRTGADVVMLEGLEVGTSSSALGKVEKAFSNISADVIDASLFVSVAGKTQLRGNELSKRTQLYRQLVKQLAQALGVPEFKSECSSRIGY